MHNVSFGRNFKVVWEADPHREKSREVIQAHSEIDRDAAYHRRLAIEVSQQLRQEVISASKTTVKDGTLQVEDEPIYPTILLGSDASLFQGLTQLTRKLTTQLKGQEVVYSNGILANLSPNEYNKILSGLESAKKELLAPNGKSRLDITI